MGIKYGLPAVLLLVLGVHSIIVIAATATPPATKTVVILSDGVDLTMDLCGTEDGPIHSVLSSMVEVLSTWMKYVSSDDIDFVVLSSACGDVQAAVLQLMEAIANRHVVGVVTMVTSHTGDTIDDVMRTVDIPLIQIATGNDVINPSTNENRYVVGHYRQSQLSTSLLIINQLNWTSISIDSRVNSDNRSLLPLQEAAIGRNLCVLPDLDVTTKPRVIIHTYSYTQQTPDFGCYDTILYMGPGLDFGQLKPYDCKTNQSILTVEMTDEKLSKFCATLLQSNLKIEAKVEAVLSLCSSNTSSRSGVGDLDSSMNAGNILTAFSFLLQTRGGNIINLIQETCNKNVITRYVCSLVGESQYDLDVQKKLVTGNEIQNSYRFVEIHHDDRSKTTHKKTNLSDLPLSIKNIDCDNTCHLCYKCLRKNQPFGNISLSRNSGELFVVGLFPLHTSSSMEKCDVTNPLGQAQALAFLATVERMTSGSRLPKLRRNIRGAILDTCDSHLRASSLLHSIELCQSTWAVSDKSRSKSLLTLQPSTVLSYFHANSHHMMGSNTKHPHHNVSITKSGFSSLRDTRMLFVRHLLDVLLGLEWTTLNVIISPDSPFEEMGLHLNHLRLSSDICFVRQIKLISNKDGLYTDVIHDVSQSSLKTTVFLLLTSEDDTVRLFDAMKGLFLGRKLQFVFTPWNGNAHESPAVQSLSDENLILEPLVESTDLDDVIFLRNNIDFSKYSLPGGVGESLHIDAMVASNQNDIALVTSSVRKFFAEIIEDDQMLTEFSFSGVNVDSTGLTVVATNVNRRQKRTIAKFDSRFQSFLKISPRSQCQGWCPECHACRSEFKSTQTFFHKPGDVIITGLFPLHKEGPQVFQCGEVQDNAADFLNVFAFMFAFETFHFRYPDLRSNLSIGGLVLDTCSSSLTTARTISDFETCRVSFVGSDFRTQNEVPKSLLSNETSQTPSAYQNLGYVVMDEVLNGNVLKNVLSGSQFGEMIFVTDDLLGHQYVARAIVKIITQLGWNHAFLVSENTPYYQSIAQEIIANSPYSDLCIVFQTVFGVQNEWRVERALDGFEDFPVILISRKSSAYSLFDWLGDLARSYFWVVSATTSDWDDYDPNTIPLGSIILKSPETENEEFASWKQKPLDSALAPTWLRSFWQYRYSCHLEDGGDNKVKGGTTMPCSVDALKDESHVLTPVTSYIIRTVDAIMHRVQKRYFDVCQGHDGVCQNLLDDNRLGGKLGLGDRDVSFSYQGETVEVDSNGLVFVTLSVFNLKHIGPVKVGSFFKSSLTLSKELVSRFYPNGSAYHVTDVDVQCRHRCSCIISVNASHQPSELLPSYRYREYKGEFLGDLWSIVVAAIAGAGAMTCLILIVYVVYKVCKRAIGKRYVGLGLFLLVSLILLYASVLPFVISASDVICGLRFLFHGVSFCLVLAGILVKLMTIQSYKIIGLGGEISGVNQIITVFFIVGVQVAISVQWWVYNAPMLLSGTDAFDVQKFACEFDRASFAYFHCYLASLLLLCTLYAVVVRKEKKNMGEAKLLMVCCFVCLALWTAWATCLFVLDREHSDLITCTSILACASTIMLVIFVPKIRMVAGLKYNISHKDPIKNGYTIDTDFLYERPFSLPGTLTSTFSASKISPPKPLSHFDSDVNY